VTFPASRPTPRYTFDPAKPLEGLIATQRGALRLTQNGSSHLVVTAETVQRETSPAALARYAALPSLVELRLFCCEQIRVGATSAMSYTLTKAGKIARDAALVAWTNNGGRDYPT
jgi:hypothetical protein